MPRPNNSALAINTEQSKRKRSAVGVMIGNQDGAIFFQDNPSVPVKLIKLEEINEREVNDFRQYNIPELAESIKQFGLIDPITVSHRVGEHNTYTIISGHRRYRAYKLLNINYPNTDEFKTIPCSIYELTDNDEELTSGLPYISAATEEEMYRESNLQSRQLTYAEVAKQIRHIIDRLDDTTYYRELSQLTNDSTRYSYTKGDRVKMIMSLLSSYSYQGWQRETIRRYLKVDDAVKEGKVDKSVLDDIEDQKITVKAAYNKYIATPNQSLGTESTRNIKKIKKSIEQIQKSGDTLTVKEKSEIKDIISLLQNLL